MSSVIKLSSPATRQFWALPVLYEDTHLLVLDKPSGLFSAPDRHEPDRPSLLQLLHAAIAEGKPWARERGLSYLANAYRLDSEISGLLLLAKSKPVLVTLVSLFGSEKPLTKYLALVHGAPAERRFAVEAKLAPHHFQPGRMRVDLKHGKRARTRFEVLECFAGWTLLQCAPLTGRPHQIRVHLRHAGLPVVGDRLYGGKPLLLSRLKRGYRLKPQRVERPLLDRAAIHLEQLDLPHPVTGAPLSITAPWPKDLTVAVKYLRKFAPVGSAPLE